MTEKDDLTQKEFSVVAFLLRFPLGILFFFAGLNKLLGGFGNYVNWMMTEMTEKTWLPGILLAPYTYTLPFIEIILGVLLLLGLFSRQALALTGLLLISLMFGKVLTQDHATVASITNYILVAAVAYYFHRFNRFSLDALRAKK